MYSAPSPSRPYDSGMTVVDRPTISGRFLGRFHALSLPNKLRMPVSTVASHETNGARRSAQISLLSGCGAPDHLDTTIRVVIMPSMASAIIAG
jgi:hypothetical protein